jgi:pimeloyl-ACP methyl ester carboxylesterase
MTLRNNDDCSRIANRGAAGLRYYASTALLGGLVLAATALVNRQLAKSAERDNPPAGRFLEIDGVRLHYVERGTGEALVLLHGNGSMIEDFESSGLLEKASKSFRVLAFDRPGFGHSNRPRGVVWTPEVQAELIYQALRRLGVSTAIVLGHSWGASVAIALGLRYPNFTRALVLASGYYYPSARLDVIVMSPPALPIIGTLLSHTISPVVSRLMWPLLTKKVFAPAQVPQKFSHFPKEMAMRPSQIRASAGEAALMVPDAIVFHKRYGELKMPVAIIAGQGDRIIDTDEQSARLHREVEHSTFSRVLGAGHMVHQTAPYQVMTAVREAANLGSSRAEGSTVMDRVYG